jgi:hypothetical protein
MKVDEVGLFNTDVVYPWKYWSGVKWIDVGHIGMKWDEVCRSETKWNAAEWREVDV